jgi:putative toxin-antitoxin system antitoxin component (TIGR02293 family)
MAFEVRDIAAQLGGERALGRPFRNDRDVDAAIREGFPQKVVTEIMHSADLTLKELAVTLDLSTRSLHRRRREGKLAKYESDRIYRLARVIALAKRYIGDDEKARRWLKRPNRALGGRPPLALIDTEPGSRAVENVLGRIAYGDLS